jgi:hypothetical protein
VSIGGKWVAAAYVLALGVVPACVVIALRLIRLEGALAELETVALPPRAEAGGEDLVPAASQRPVRCSAWRRR